MNAAVGIDYTRTPPEAWERALGRLAPPSERLSWLKLAWLASDTELIRHREHGQVLNVTKRIVPIERWVIYQMVPHRATPSSVWAPEQRVLFDRAAKRFVTDPRYPLQLYRENMSRYQWELFLATGQYGQLLWVIQGSHGGHRRRFDRIEQKVLQLNGLPTDPPAPGDLPYADFDRRVLEKLAELDRVRFWKKAIDYCERSTDDEERAAEQHFRGNLWQWLESQVEQHVDKNAQAWRKIIEDAPRVHVTKAPGFDLDEAKHEFITAD